MWLISAEAAFAPRATLRPERSVQELSPCSSRRGVAIERRGKGSRFQSQVDELGAELLVSSPSRRLNARLEPRYPPLTDLGSDFMDGTRLIQLVVSSYLRAGVYQS